MRITLYILSGDNVAVALVAIVAFGWVVFDSHGPY